MSEKSKTSERRPPDHLLKLPHQQMRRLLRDIPALQQHTIAMFLPVYYPVAKLELELEERVYEEFVFVQLTILRLYALGYHDAERIAALLALTPDFVQGILCDLDGSGLLRLEENSVTDSGWQSLAEEKKISTVKNKQRFQADAVTGNLLYQGQTRHDGLLCNYEEAGSHGLYVLKAESISAEEIIRQLRSPEYLRRYKKRQRSVLNANVVDIVSAESVGVSYLPAYIVTLHIDHLPPAHSSFPVISVQEQREPGASPAKGQGSRKRAQVWRPLFLSQELDSLLGLEDGSYPVLPERALQPFRDICEKVLREEGGSPLSGDPERAAAVIHAYFGWDGERVPLQRLSLCGLTRWQAQAPLAALPLNAHILSVFETALLSGRAPFVLNDGHFGNMCKALGVSHRANDGIAVYLQLDAAARAVAQRYEALMRQYAGWEIQVRKAMRATLEEGGLPQDPLEGWPAWLAAAEERLREEGE